MNVLRKGWGDLRAQIKKNLISVQLEVDVEIAGWREGRWFVKKKSPAKKQTGRRTVEKKWHSFSLQLISVSSWLSLVTLWQCGKRNFVYHGKFSRLFKADNKFQCILENIIQCWKFNGLLLALLLLRQSFVANRIS